MMKSRILMLTTAVVLVMVLALGAVSCDATGGKYLVKMSVSNETARSFSMEYQDFDGYRVYKMKLSAATEVNIRFVTVSGRLDYRITDAKGEVILEQENVTDMGFGTVFKKGEYTVRLTAEHHQGSYSFSW